MKILIASDIHGSARWCAELFAAFDREKAERMLLLGDLLYHGPRNDLPEGYAPKEVLAMLNERRHSLFCVRGNCDAEVDQLVLKFPILADYCLLPQKNTMIYATHGHHIDTIPLCEGDILLYGHTHVPACARAEGVWHLNPGSVALPKNDTPHSYMILEDGRFLWKELPSGNVYREFPLEGC